MYILFYRRFRNHNISTNVFLVNTVWFYSLYWCMGVSSVTTDICHILQRLQEPIWHLVSNISISSKATGCLKFFFLPTIYLVWYGKDIYYWEKVRVMVFNITFNNISVISWRSILLMEKTGENHRHAASHWWTLSHNVVSSIRKGYGCKWTWETIQHFI